MIATQLDFTGGVPTQYDSYPRPRPGDQGRYPAAPPASPAAARDAAIDRVERGADGMWMDAAFEAIDAHCQKLAPFTTDDVWDLLAWRGIPAPREPRAMGAAMRRAEQAGLIRPTGGYRTSRRAECHARPARVWEGVR